MVKQKITKLIQQAIRKAQRKGDLSSFIVPEIPLEHPRQAEHGDYATPICLQLARMARMAPVKIADILIKYLPETDYLGKIEIAHPGYINFTLDEAWLAQRVEAILAAGEDYGNVQSSKLKAQSSKFKCGKKVQVEYVSANPTGPLTIGSGRNAVIGDTLANVLSAAGYEVQREYYINDRGSQMELFDQTLYARYAQALGCDEPIPEQGYRGTYMIEIGREIAEEMGDKFLQMSRAEAVAAIGRIGLEKLLQGIEEDLSMMGIRYDNWFSEQSLYDDGYFAKIMTLLRQSGHIVEREGAVWFTATELGGDKDEVIVRSDGEPGYFASDIAYHYNKFVARGFDWVIDVWGADHQGHVPRMKAMMCALGLDPDRLTLLIYQLVTLKRGGEVVRLSKRTGDIITLREVIEDVGPDAVRFFLLARAADSQMDFDLDLAVEQSAENPVYYVQYGHARIASILRYATERVPDFADGDVLLLRHPAELALIRHMLLLPEVVEQAVENLAPHHLTYYAQHLASVFHSFYKECRVVSSDPAEAELNKARLKLVSAAKIVLAKTLRLMGMTAPERM
ncbi:MAG: arginine--tRNA ligase [Anaerolineae bacterium]|nr:arginine--tRNA ligase [Anaerolineae bacterium]